MDRVRAPRLARRLARPSSRGIDALESRTLLTTFMVTTDADDGPGSLRGAIELANLSFDPDEIRFNIPGEGLYRRIRPLSPLPEVVAPLTIDGRTQPGYAASPIVELDGSGAGFGADGLRLSAMSVVRGLAINRFAGHGVAVGPARSGRPDAVPVPGGTGSRLEMNYIGTDVTGNVDLGNGGAGVMVAASGVTLGAGTPGISAAAGRNVISGNGAAGVWVNAGLQGITGLALTGNLIGTNVGGNRALGNDREGVLISGANASATIGGPVRPDEVRNVISGNAASGIRVTTLTGGNVTVEGNFIGTDLSGANALGNGRSAVLPYRDGVTFAGGTLRLGGPSPTSRNVISANAGAGVAILFGTDVQVTGNFIGTDLDGNADLGNGTDGVAVDGQQALARVNGNVISGNGRNGVRAANVARGVQIGGNYIGTNAAGGSALGNGDDGVELDNVRVPVMVGGPGVDVVPGPLINPAATGRNVIAANGGHGINIFVEPSGAAPPHRIIGNFVGTDATGAVPLGNGGSGIYLAAPGVSVGGPSPSDRNVISANRGNGITIMGPGVLAPIAPTGIRVEGNLIGGAAQRTGTGDPVTDAGMGNGENGVAIYYSSNNRIGGPTPALGNVIAFNGGSGVLVQGEVLSTGPGVPAAAEGNPINSNRIYGNGKLGIDLAPGGEGVTPNDPRDADLGPNRLQNHPVITQATYASGAGQVRFTLHGEPGRSYRIDVFASLAPDPSGRGEGQMFTGTVTVTSDAAGNATGTWSGPVPGPGRTLPPGSVVFYTATATEGGRNNTSEFSPAVRGGPVQPGPTPFPQGSARVVGRHVFYNNSAFDRAGGDDAAVAPDKRALLPGGQAAFANVTSYDRGINGVMVDIADLPQGVVLTPDEFEARTAHSADGVFRPAHKPYAVNVRRGAGVNGSDRVTLYWSDNLPNADGVAPAVANGWLEVKVLANEVTGLAASDLFYFGNLGGETGNRGVSSGTLRVEAIDLARTRAAGPWDPPMLITSRFDHNRDGDVDAADVGVVRANYGRSLAPPAAGPVASAAASGERYRPAPVSRLAEELLQ